MTIEEVLKWGTNYLSGFDLENPKLNAELLLSHLLNLDRINLILNKKSKLPDKRIQGYKELIYSRSKNIPLQHLTGKVNFFGLELIVNKDVLIPRPETEELLYHVLKKINCNSNPPKCVLDIGTGSGCLAISIAKHFPESKVWAIDKSDEALKIAKMNAENLKIENLILERCDILNELPKYNQLDLIISNPPYISEKEYKLLEPGVRNFEPENSLTDNYDGLTFYRRFAEIFQKLLTKNSFFALEIGYGQSKSIYEIFTKNNFHISFENDFNDIPRFAFGYF